MVREHQKIANHVIKSFQVLLASDVGESIGEQHFDALKTIVIEALAEHSETILERIDAVIKQPGTEVEKRPIEL